MTTEKTTEAAFGESRLTDELERIADEIQDEWQMGGLGKGTMYCDFAVEVAKRAVAIEREACAILGARTMEDMGRKAGGKIFADGQVIADAIRARSNSGAKVRREAASALSDELGAKV